MRYGTFSRARHPENPTHQQFTGRSDREIIKVVFGTAEPSPHSRLGIDDHPFLTITIVQGVKDVDLMDLKIPGKSTRKFMLDAVCSSLDPLQTAGWIKENNRLHP